MSNFKPEINGKKTQTKINKTFHGFTYVYKWNINIIN